MGLLDNLWDQGGLLEVHNTPQNIGIPVGPCAILGTPQHPGDSLLYLWQQSQDPTISVSSRHPWDPWGCHGIRANYGDTRHPWHPVLSVGPQDIHGTLYYPWDPELSMGTLMGP